MEYPHGAGDTAAVFLAFVEECILAKGQQNKASSRPDPRDSGNLSKTLRVLDDHVVCMISLNIFERLQRLVRSGFDEFCIMMEKDSVGILGAAADGAEAEANALPEV